MPGLEKLDRIARRVVPHDLRAASEALGQIRIRDRELVEYGASGVTDTAFPTAPWYRALAFADSHWLYSRRPRRLPATVRMVRVDMVISQRGPSQVKLLVVALIIILTVLGAVCASLLREAAMAGRTAAAAGAHASGRSVRACAVGNPWRRQERGRHPDLQWFEVQAKGGSGSRIRDRRAGCIQELQRCRRARPSAGAAGVAHSGSHSVPRRYPSLPAVRRGDAEGYRGWSGRSSAGRPASESRGQREAAASRQHDLAR